MSRITSLLQQFNESTWHMREVEFLISFLDDHAPEWRKIIKERDEWLPLFRQDVHVFQSRRARLAAIFFDIIDQQDALIAVWNDEQCYDYYRFTAIRKLREIDESTYLPQYLDWFKDVQLGMYVETKELFDFDGAMEVAIDMVTSPRLNSNDEELGKTYLAQIANLWWDKYPAIVREKVLHRNYYSMVEICDENLWSMMSQEERAFITTDIRIASVNKATIHPFLKSILKSRRRKRN